MQYGKHKTQHSLKNSTCTKQNINTILTKTHQYISVVLWILVLNPRLQTIRLNECYGASTSQLFLLSNIIIT